MRKQLVVIGAGMAAAYLLQELRRADANVEITVIGEEANACYNRVLLSNLLAGDSAEADLQMLEPATNTSSVKFLLHTRVLSVDTAQRRVLTDRGQALSYDQLVFATGACVARPAHIDTGLRGVEQFRTLADARHLRELANSGGPAVVVGGGLLGLEAAHGLNTLGFTTTVVHRQAYLMNRQLDPEGARQLQRKLARNGIHFRLSDAVSALHSEAATLSGITLNSGETLPCKLLLLATGIVPTTALATAAGVAVQRGILIDGMMRTSVPGVFALGECSQLGADCFGLVAPIREQAQVLARELMGTATCHFSPGHSPTQLKISGIEIYSAGTIDNKDEQLVLRDDNAGIYRRLVVRDDRLVGAVLVGDKRGGSWYSELISSGVSIADFRSGLMFGREVSEALQPGAKAA